MTTVDWGLGPGAEFDLIREMLAAATTAGREEGDGPLDAADPPGAGVQLGPGDDAALVGDGRMAVSTDLSVEGVHFRSEWITPREVGYRAVTAALSDMAAMAARPIGGLLSLAIDRERAPRWAPEIAAGAGAALGRHRGVLLGGDLSRTPDEAPIVIDVTVVGEADRPLRRSGSRPGDRLWVTGTLGGAAAAVEIWTSGQGDPAAPLRERFSHPEARVAEARWLAERDVARALIDLSDGLAADARHLAAAGGVRILLDPKLLQVDPNAEAALGAERALELALAGGEDYELAFTAAPGAVEEVVAEFRERFALALTRVGEVTSGAGLDIVGLGSAEWRAHGWNHFGDGR